MTSHFEIHSVKCDLPSRRLDFAALRRVFIENRVGIVDVNINAPLRRDRRHVIEAPSRTADRQMTHRECGLGPRPLRDQLVVTPTGAVEQDAIATPDDLREARIYLLDTGDVGDRAPAPLVDKSESNRRFIWSVLEPEVS